MQNYIIRRLLQLVPTLLILSFLIFSLLYITPGDPIALMLGSGESGAIQSEIYETVKKDLGLDQPFFVRYFNFISNAIKGDLGQSYVTKQDVFTEIMARMPATLCLTGAAAMIAILIAFPLGILSALKKGSIWDACSSFLATVGVSLPKFWFAFVLILVFSRNLGWFPSNGMAHLEEGIGPFFRHLMLPAFSLGIGLAAVLMRILRANMLECMTQDYVKFARSKGLRERTVILIHTIKNALAPVITVFGSEVGGLIGGAVVTETVFAWPGVGRLIMSSIGKRDYPMIQGTTLLLCAMYLCINLIVDLCCAWLNPRIRLDKKGGSK